LSTFELDRDLFGRLADGIPSGVVRIAESAVASPDDVAHYRRAGADVVLVGEALVTHGDPVDALTRFLEV
jgi:indole-3-glycerol phosphate synthase